jgi:peptidyl-prolyl cis-trans isomerase C
MINLVRSFGVALLLFATLSNCKSEGEKTAEQPVIVVNKRVLTAKDFAKRLAIELKPFDALYAKHPQNVRRVKEHVVQNFINESLIADWAEQHQIQVTDQQLEAEVNRVRGQYPDDISFRGAFAKEGFSFQDWKLGLRKTLLSQYVFKEATKDVKSPTEQELKSYFDTNKLKFQKEPRAHLRQIVVEKEDDSRRILEELRKGRSFEKLASEFSVAPEGRRGGDLGWIEKGTLAVFDTAFTLSPGKRSEVLKSPYGFHIIELLAKRPGSQLNFQEARASILQELRTSKEQDAYKEWVKSQLQKAHVLRNDVLFEDVRVHTEME